MVHLPLDIALFAAILPFMLADINFKHCLGPVDLGRNPEKGIFPNVCIVNHHFHGRTHSWFFGRSTVKDTNFTSCTFEKEGDHSFWKVDWRNVIFKDCTFRKSSKMIFHETSFRSVLFDSCMFEESANVFFTKFAFSNVEFRNCTFLSRTELSLGNVETSSITNSVLGVTEGESNGEGNILLTELTIDRFIIRDSTSTAEIRTQQAQLSLLQVYDSTLASLWCHEEIIAGHEVKKASQLNDTVFERVVFRDGFFCEHATLSRAELRDIAVRNKFSLHSSQVEDLVLSNLTSLDETCSTFDLSCATVDGGRLEMLSTTKGTFEETIFKSHVAMPGFKISETNYSLKDAIFSSERINNECCTVSCRDKGCRCDVPLEPVFCPRGDSVVNVNVKDPCFPANAKVFVVTDKGHIEEIRMEHLRHGDQVLTSHSKVHSPVFFFGHKTVNEYALYQVISASDGVRTRHLAISRGHLLPTASRGVLSAEKIVVGDILQDMDGQFVKVTRVTSEIRRGLFAPTTLTGNIVVDGIVASCYTDIVPACLAHAALAPLRATYRMGGLGRRLSGQMRLLHEWSPAPGIRMMQNAVRWHVGRTLGSV